MTNSKPEPLTIVPGGDEREALEVAHDALQNQGAYAGTMLIVVDGERIELPPSLATLLLRAADSLRRGRGVALLTVDGLLTTQQAADLLGVSRPFLVKLLERGEIPYSMAGTHRRVPVGSVLRYQRERSRKRRRLVEQMAREAQELGEYVIED